MTLLKDYITIFGSTITNPQYTIAIPTFNRGLFLVDAVESALNQSYNGVFEVMVVDNNPERNDITEQLMSKFTDNPKVSYFKNSSNIGMFGNWNRLFELATGKYVVMLHDDDLLFDCYLAIMDSFINKTKGRYKQIYSLHYSTGDRTKQISLEKHVKIEYKEKKQEDFSSGCALGIPSGMMLYKDCFDAIGPFNSDFFPCSDIEFAVRSTKIIKCCQIRVPMVLYYVGVNETMNPLTAQKVPYQYERIQDILQIEYPYFWKAILKLTRRANLNSICSHICTFADASYVRKGLEEIGYKSNKVKDTISKFFQYIVKLYLYLARTRSIKLEL